MRYLKIKDSVDLKELEKFGFEKVSIFEAYIYQNEFSLNRIEIRESKGRKISLFKEPIESADKLLNIIYDLIKADIVEKVDD